MTQPEIQQNDDIPGLAPETRNLVNALGEELRANRPFFRQLRILNDSDAFKNLRGDPLVALRHFLQQRAGNAYRVELDTNVQGRTRMEIMNSWRYEAERFIGGDRPLVALPPANPNTEVPANLGVGIVKLAQAVAASVRTNRTPMVALNALNTSDDFIKMRSNRNLVESLRRYLQAIIGDQYAVIRTGPANATRLFLQNVNTQRGDFVWMLGTVVDDVAQNGEELVAQTIRRRLQAPDGTFLIDRPGLGFTLTDTFTLQAHLDRQYAVRLIEINPNPTPQQQLEIEAAMDRIEHMKTFSRVFSQYMEMVRRYESLYEECRADGVPMEALAKGQKQALDHLEVVRKWSSELVEHHLALFRLSLQENFDRVAWAASPDGAQWRKTTNALETRLWENIGLRQERNGVQSGPPVHAATLDLIDARYRFLLARANKETSGSPQMAKMAVEVRRANLARGRVQHVNERMGKVLRQNRLAEFVSISRNSEIVPWAGIPENEELRNKNLKSIQEAFARENVQFTPEFEWTGGPYTYNAYLSDIEASNAEGSSLARFEIYGRDNVLRISRWSQSLAQWHVENARMTTVRNRFNQLWHREGLAVRVPNPRFVEAENQEYQKFLKAQAVNSFSMLEEHFKLVEDRVIVGGIGVVAERFWNQNARDIFGWFAARLTDVQTALIPNIFGLRERQHERIMGDIPNLLGWPRYTQEDVKMFGEDVVKAAGGVGAFKEPQHFSPLERRLMERHRASIHSAITTFQGSETLPAVKQSVDTTKKLHELMNPSELFQLASLSQGNRLTSDGLPASVPADGIITQEWLQTNWHDLSAEHKRKVAVRCFEQLGDSIANFGAAYGTMLESMHTVIGMHVLFERAGINFAKESGENLLWNILTWMSIYGGVFLASVAAPYIIHRAIRGIVNRVRGSGQNSTQSAESETRPSPSQPDRPSSQISPEERSRRFADLYNRFGGQVIEVGEFRFTPMEFGGRNIIRIESLSGADWSYDIRGDGPASPHGTPTDRIQLMENIIGELHGMQTITDQAVKERFPGQHAVVRPQAGPAQAPRPVRTLPSGLERPLPEDRLRERQTRVTELLGPDSLLVQQNDHVLFNDMHLVFSSEGIHITPPTTNNVPAPWSITFAPDGQIRTIGDVPPQALAAAEQRVIDCHARRRTPRFMSRITGFQSLQARSTASATPPPSVSFILPSGFGGTGGTLHPRVRATMNLLTDEQHARLTPEERVQNERLMREVSEHFTAHPTDRVLPTELRERVRLWNNGHAQRMSRPRGR